MARGPCLLLALLIAAVNCYTQHGLLPTARLKSTAVQCNADMSSTSLLTDKEILSFMRDGHLLKRGLINSGLITDTVSPSLMQLYNQNILTAWRHKLKIILGMDSDSTKELTVSDCELLLADTDKEEIPFMQLFNLWYASDDVRTLALSTELGRVAAQLLGSNLRTRHLSVDNCCSSH